MGNVNTFITPACNHLIIGLFIKVSSFEKQPTKKEALF
jgi:hypothetical protein